MGTLLLMQRTRATIRSDAAVECRCHRIQGEYIDFRQLYPMVVHGVPSASYVIRGVYPPRPYPNAYSQGYEHSGMSIVQSFFTSILRLVALLFLAVLCLCFIFIRSMRYLPTNLIQSTGWSDLFTASLIYMLRWFPPPILMKKNSKGRDGRTRVRW